MPKEIRLAGTETKEMRRDQESVRRLAPPVSDADADLMKLLGLKSQSQQLAPQGMLDQIREFSEDASVRYHNWAAARERRKLNTRGPQQRIMEGAYTAPLPSRRKGLRVLGGIAVGLLSCAWLGFGLQGAATGGGIRVAETINNYSDSYSWETGMLFDTDPNGSMGRMMAIDQNYLRECQTKPIGSEVVAGVIAPFDEVVRLIKKGDSAKLIAAVQNSPSRSPAEKERIVKDLLANFGPLSQGLRNATSLEQEREVLENYFIARTDGSQPQIDVIERLLSARDTYLRTDNGFLYNTLRIGTPKPFFVRQSGSECMNILISDTQNGIMHTTPGDIR